MITSLRGSCSSDPNLATQLIYWTDRDRQHRRIAARAGIHEASDLAFDVPPQSAGTVLYYYFEQARFATPFEGAANPYVFFISDDHLGDLDRHGDVLDVFDLIRLLRHIAWQEPLANAAPVDLNHDGAANESDVALIVGLMVPERARRGTNQLATVETADSAVTLRLGDGSWLSVPRDFSGRQTDLSLSLNGEMAPMMLSSHRTFTSLQYAGRRPMPGECEPASHIAVNSAFNYVEPHMMQRYMALALDNIRRDPAAFVAASLYRMVRLFVVRGTSDVATAQQFRSSRIVYGVGTALSIGYLAAFLAGVVVAYRRRSALLVFLVPIVYVPVTIGFVLTNMRYSVTVQPLMFVFLAVAIMAAWRLQPAGVETSESAT